MCPLNDLPEGVWIEKNDLASESALGWLIDIYISSTEVYHFVNNRTEFIYLPGETFEQVYTPLDFSVSEFQNNSNGNMSRTLTVLNESLIGILLPIIEGYEGLSGKTLLLTPVYLNDPTINMSSKAQEFEIKNAITAETQISIELSSVNPLNESIPSQTYLSLYCRYVKYFKFPPCNYAGDATSCDGTLTNCKLLENEPNFGGTIGLESKSIKFAV